MGPGQARILRNSAIIGVALSVGSYPLFQRWDITLAVFLGALAMAINFWLLAVVLSSVLNPDSKVPKWKIYVRLLLKISFLFGVLAVLIFGPEFEPLALLAGVSSVVLAIFAEGVLPTIETDDQGGDEEAR